MIQSHKLACALFSLLSAAVLGVVGCQKSTSPPTAEADRPSPADSFSELVELARDGIEMHGADAGGFVASDGGSSSRFQVHNKVSSSLIPPTAAGEPYRGTITVSSQSIYSLRQSVDSNKRNEKDGDQPAERRGSSLLEDEGDEGFNSFDKSLVSEGVDADEKDATDKESIQRRADEVSRTYDFVYNNGRWALVTKLDPKTEASIQNAFDRAVRLQP